MRDYIIKWKALEYERVDRSADWFWAFGIVVVAIILASLIFGNVLFAFLILVSAAALFIFAIRHPLIDDFEVNQKGIVLEDKLYLYRTLSSFWIEMEDGSPKLLIKSKKIIMPLLVLPLSEEVEEEELRDYLLDHLDEEHLHEPLIQKVMERLGF